MAMVVVDASCLKHADSQPKSCGLVWGSAAAWRCSTFTRWTEWTLAMTWSWWQHYKYRPGYYYYIIIIIIIATRDNYDSTAIRRRTTVERCWIASNVSRTEVVEWQLQSPLRASSSHAASDARRILLSDACILLLPVHCAYAGRRILYCPKLSNCHTAELHFGGHFSCYRASTCSNMQSAILLSNCPSVCPSVQRSTE